MRHRLASGLLALGLVAAAVLPGCRCGPTAQGRIKKDLERRLKAEMSAPEPEADEAATGTAADPFSVEQRMGALRESYVQRRHAYVIAEAVGLLSKGVDEATQMEIWMMLAEAYAHVGDADRKIEALVKFREIYERTLASDRVKGEQKGQRTLAAVIARLKERRGPRVLDTPEGEPRESDRLWEKVAPAGPDEVLTLALSDGTEVLASKNPMKLLERATGPGGEELAVHREPEHGFWYAIREGGR